MDSGKSPVIRFYEFSPEKEDIYGWWHVSCSYSFQDKVVGTLYNSVTSERQEYPLAGIPFFFPSSSLEVSVNGREG